MLLQTVLVKNKNISLKLVRFIFSSKLLILWLKVTFSIHCYYTMNFMQEQGLAKSRSHAHF